MSLGLHASDFQLVLANELSPMAAETFAFNHLGIDLSTGSRTSSDHSKSVLWLTSQHSEDQLGKRLRENPSEFPDWRPDSVNSDVPKKGLIGHNNLVVGSIIELNNFLEHDFEKNPEHRKHYEVDLVSGGPPCQSFSMAGLRQRANHRNRLPWEFARFVQLVKPKVALLENVSGILRAFTEGDEEFHAWIEVAKAFVEIGYAPLCLHVNAKNVGVAQNRPRFLMFALRLDQARSIRNLTSLTEFESSILNQGIAPHEMPNFNWETFKYWDLASPADRGLFSTYLFSPLNTHPTKSDWVSVQDAIHDLSHNVAPNQESRYVNRITKIFPAKGEASKIPNKEYRKHTIRVQQRFRLHQILTTKNNAQLTLDVSHALRGGIFANAKENFQKLEEESFLFEDGTFRQLRSQAELVQLLKALATRKHSQKALVANRPAPAALSIPDDCCHYSSEQPRTLSVREMARIQSFPDWFEFRSKVTTGGTNRKFEVPQYTQVGNAVPPLLAMQAGLVVNRLLEKAALGEKELRESGDMAVASTYPS